MKTTHPSFVFDTPHPECPQLQASHAASEARISLQGGQLLAWQPAGHRPVLWLSPKARWAPGTPIRGGIPVCWPWFGSHPSDPQAPAHGHARTTPWVLERCVASSPMCSEVLLSLPPQAARSIQGPHPVRLELAVRLDEQLSLSLSTTNLGDQPLALSEALHTYFCVSDIDAVRVGGLEGVEYLDKVQGFRRCRQEGAIAFAGEVDRVFVDAPPQCTLHDSGWGRRIELHSHGSRSTVVWNPGAERAAQFNDIDDGGYRSFVCVETANAHDNTLTLQPGEHHTMAVHIRVVSAA